jgi:stage V sporulation protein G
MEITEVKVSLKNEVKLKGFANITFDDLFVIRGLKIIRGINGYFIAMPTRKRRNGMYTDVAHPICREFRQQMEEAVMAKYWEEVNSTV